jgi:hypothetical protein
MAEATAMRNNALPYPIYGAPFTIVFPFLDADGDLVTGASTPDAEISKNGDTFADCTNESTEIATSSGVYYLTLTGTELTCDIAAIIAKSAAAGMKTTVATLYPRKLATVRSGTSASAGSSTSTIVLDASASPVDDFYNGMVVIATIDGNVEARVISDYVGSTQTASVSPDWNVAPDNNDTFIIKMPEGVPLSAAHVMSMADGAVTAAAIANDAIDAASLASDVATEIATGVWAAGTRTLSALDEDNTTLDLDATIRAAVGLASANLDTQIGDLPTNAELATSQASADDATLAAIAALNNLSAAQVNAEVDTALVDIHLDHLLAATYDPASKPGAADALLNELVESDGGVARFTANALEQAPSGGGSLTVQDIVDGVWDEPIASHVDSGSTGEALSAAGGAGDPWITALPGSYTSGQAGFIVGTNLNATVSSRATQTSVDDLPTNAELATELGTADDAVLAAISGLSIPSAASIATAVWGAATRLLTAGTNIVLAKGTGVTGFNDLSAAEVNSEVVDALNVDTYAEPGQGAPAATTSLAAKIGYLFKAWRNKTTQTADTYSLFADDGSTVDQKATVSDDGTTFTRGETVTGA